MCSRSIYRAFVDTRFKTKKKLFFSVQGPSVWFATRQAYTVAWSPALASWTLCTARKAYIYILYSAKGDGSRQGRLPVVLTR